MPSQILVLYGHVVRSMRIKKGISQEEFASICGLHRTYISDIELGKRNISLENMEKISCALDVELSEIFREVEQNAGI